MWRMCGPYTGSANSEGTHANTSPAPLLFPRHTPGQRPEPAAMLGLQGREISNLCRRGLDRAVGRPYRAIGRPYRIEIGL